MQLLSFPLLSISDINWLKKSVSVINMLPVFVQSYHVWQVLCNCKLECSRNTKHSLTGCVVIWLNP
jgi:hypothetical protein